MYIYPIYIFKCIHENILILTQSRRDTSCYFLTYIINSQPNPSIKDPVLQLCHVLFASFVWYNVKSVTVVQTGLAES